MSCQNLIKLPKWRSAKRAAYIIPLFVPVLTKKNCGFPQLCSCDPSVILISEHLQNANIPELIKTPNHVTTRNYPIEECRR